MPESDIKLAVSIIGLGLVALVTLACAGLYALEEFILRRKLNLD